MKIHERTETVALLELLAELGLEYVIAGGYPRDLYYGLEPRDMDICIFGVGSAEKNIAINQMYDVLSKSNQMLSSIQVDDEDYPHDRIDAVFKTTYDVDVIIYKDSFESAQSVLDSFDFNINQFVLYKLAYRDKYTEMMWPFMEKHGKLIQLREESISPERKAKMVLKAKQCNWSI